MPGLKISWISLPTKIFTGTISIFQSSCYAYFANKCCTEAPTITNRAIPYAFHCKPSNELFPSVYFAAYSHLPGCHLRNCLTPRTPASSLWFVRCRLYGHVSCVPQQLSSRQNGEFCGYHVQSSLM